MSQSTVFTINYPPDDPRLAADEREIWRYCGYPRVPSESGGLRGTLGTVMRELGGAFVYRICWLRTPLVWHGSRLMAPFEVYSADLEKCLRGCGEAIMFAATVGLTLDRYIARAQTLSPLKALLAQGYGTERVGRLCDLFCREVSDAEAVNGLSCTPRFSPGYGDLPLDAQRDFFRLLDCGRNIGISLSGSLLMTPSKSVTAIFGLRPRAGSEECFLHSFDCGRCAKADCEFRRTTDFEQWTEATK